LGLPKPGGTVYPVAMTGARIGCMVALAALAGCSVEIPGFLGREGDTSGTTGTFQVRREPLPDPRPVPLRAATLERALHGVILRVEGEAPTWGFHSAALRPLGNGAPDAAGILGFELVAIPPEPPEPAGAPRTRELTAAVFVPTLALKEVRGFRVAGAGNVQTLPLPAGAAP
jgi:hypothetical protein